MIDCRMTSDQSPGERAAPGSFFPGKRAQIVCWGGALLFGAIQAWSVRHTVDPDGLCYLDLASAFSQRGWSALINAFWSPLYPAILGAVFRALKPSRCADAPIAHILNFAVYALALASFEFLWRTLRRYQEERLAARRTLNVILLPQWAWRFLGFVLFVWTALQLTELLSINPDVLLTAAIYLAAGLVIRIRMNPAGWRAYLALGVVLGLGYLAKAPMFPMAFVFLGVSAFTAGGIRVALPRLSLALLVFVAIAAPFLAALSSSMGRLTFGDSAKFNYAWYIDDYPDNWTGQPAGSGTPRHPIQKILDDPPAYAYAAPFKATRPFDYDPSYWNEGMKTHFSLREQARALKDGVSKYFEIFVKVQGALLVGAVVLFLYGARGREALRDLAENWPILIPSLAGLGMYALVHVETRYVAAYAALFWASVLSALRLPDSAESRRVAAAASIAMVVTLGASIVRQAATDIHAGFSDSERVECDVGQALDSMGIQSGDEVASAGDPFLSYWARVAGVSITAEVRMDSLESYWWPKDPQMRARVFQAFAGAGVKALIIDRLPAEDWPKDWQRVGNTSYFVHRFTRPGG